MIRIEIIAGSFGRGIATYNHGELHFPEQLILGVEAVAQIDGRGAVLPKQHWSEAAISNLRSGLAVASNLELTGAASLAVAAIGAGLAKDRDPSQSQQVIEVTFTDGRGFVALAPEGLAILIQNDRTVLQRAYERNASHSLETIPQSRHQNELLTSASAMASATAEAAGSALSSAMSFVRRKREA